MIRNENIENGVEKKITVKKAAFFILAFAIGYLTSVTMQVIL